MSEIIVYQGKPYITIDGRMRKAQENPLYQGMDVRPATDEERRAYRALDTDHLWRCEAYRSDWRKPDGSLRPAIGWGLVRKGSHEKNFIANSTPELIAEKRAKARALRDLFQIPLPSAEEEDGWVAPPKWVDPKSGEILDSRPGGMLATHGHLATIHLLCKQLGLTEDARHEQLRSMFGKSAANELTEGEAAAYLEYLGALAEEKLANDPVIIDLKAKEEGVYSPPRAASKRFHTASAAASFAPPGVVEPEPERPDPSMAEGMILEGPNGQRFVVDGGRLVPFVEAPRETEAPSPEDAHQVRDDPTQGAVAEDAESDPAEDRVEEEQPETSESSDGHTTGNLPEGIPADLANRILALAESADSAEPQPWWQNAETVAGNKGATRRFLKGAGVKFSEAAVTALFRLLTIAATGKDPGAGSAEGALPPAYCAVLQGQAKADLAAMKDDLEMLVLEGVLG